MWLTSAICVNISGCLTTRIYAAIPSNGCLQVPYSGRTEPLHRLTPLSRLDKRLCGRHYNSPVDRFIDRFEDNLGHKASVAACAAACRSRTPNTSYWRSRRNERAPSGKTVPKCNYFIFGKPHKRNKCYQEYTSSASCPEGWDPDMYDFYELGTNPCASAMESAQGQA